MNLIQCQVSAVAAAVVAILSVGGVADPQAAVGREHLRDFVAKAPVVVLAEVTAVEGLPHGDWKATGRVIEVWKGPKREIVSYGPGGYGDMAGCEGSSARVGETVVLFLEPERDTVSDLLRIAYVGSGRLPVYTLEGKRLIETSNFFLPAGVRTSQALVGDHTRELMPLDWLREFVKDSVSEPSKESQ